VQVLLTTAIAQPSSARAEISDGVVKIGVLNDMSSLYSNATGKGSLTAAQMAVADFGGKVRGSPIEVISADHQNKPDVGSTIARTWYYTEKVDVIVEVPTSSVALAIQQITREKNRVFLISGAGASARHAHRTESTGPMTPMPEASCGQGYGRARRELVVFHHSGLCIWAIS
jgi:ABC-type branched-subunit amino acid transport system substrate-binding protein